MSNPTIELSSDGMGDNVTEDDFDRWTSYVCNRIDDACGFVVDVEQAKFGAPGGDGIRGLDRGDREDEERRETISRALADLWDSWCSEGAPE